MGIQQAIVKFIELHRPRDLLRVLAAVFFTAALAACSQRVELLSQVTDSQANEVLAALMRQGIAAQKIPGKEGKVSVSVPQERVADAIDIMQANGLPREPHVRMGDVFKKEGLISSPMEERARMIYALSQELAGTIGKIDGVVDASVHVVLPERAGFGETGNASSAAVFIKHLDTAPMDTIVPQIRRLVANSISGLSYENVSVVQVPAAPIGSDVPIPAGSSVPKEVFWGILVVADSAARLRLILIGMTLLLLACCAALGFMLLRARRAAGAANG